MKAKQKRKLEKRAVPYLVSAMLAEATRHHGLIPSNVSKAFERQYLKPYFEKLGIAWIEDKESDQDVRSLAADMVKLFPQKRSRATRIARQAFGQYKSVASAEITHGADRALAKWKDQKFALLAGPCQYEATAGKLPIARTKLRSGQTIPAGMSLYFCRWQGKHLLLQLTEKNADNRYVPAALDGWYWDACVAWAEEPKNAWSFIEALAEQTNQQLIAERRGKVLSGRFAAVSIQTCRYEDLVYPPAVTRDIAELVAAFDEWQKPESPINRWGVFGIGEPGTGKTTLGGALVARKRADVTVIYCPARDFIDLQQGESHQAAIREVFRWTRLLAPTLLIMDDIDLVAGTRGHGYQDVITSCIMEELGGLPSDTRLFTAINSNKPEVVEDAILNRPGRIGTRIEFSGFDECLDELLRAQARMRNLTVENGAFESALSDQAFLDLKQGVGTITPDLARNVIDRIALSPATIITCESLTAAMRATARAFNKRMVEKTSTG